MQPDVAAHLEEPASGEVFSPELQLVVAFEVLHRLRMVEKSRSLSVEELDLIKFLVVQFALLSSSPMVEVVCEAASALSPTPSSATHEVVDMQPDHIVLLAPPHAVVDASVVVARSSSTPTVAWEPQAIGLGESFKVKPPDPAASEV
jgi:hypothetical protein